MRHQHLGITRPTDEHWIWQCNQVSCPFTPCTCILYHNTEFNININVKYVHLSKNTGLKVTYTAALFCYFISLHVRLSKNTSFLVAGQVAKTDKKFVDPVWKDSVSRDQLSWGHWILGYSVCRQQELGINVHGQSVLGSSVCQDYFA